MDHHEFIKFALTYLTAAVVAVPLFRRLGLGSVLGYLAAGGLIGPWGLKIITDPQRILSFAELGVVLLLFIIGLELSPRRLWVMRKAVFGLGSAQVAITGLAITLALANWLSWSAALVVGLGLSLSSTAFALQIMSEKGEFSSTYGRSAFGILLFQDLAAIPLLAMVPLLAARTSMEGQGDMLWGSLKVFSAILGLWVGGRFILLPALRLVASAQMREIFTAATLLVVLGSALLMDSIGLSMALGAFLAGLLLADSEHRHELEADIEPFKGLLLGLFFISVGMSVDYGLLFSSPGLIALGVFGLLAIKIAVLYALGRQTGLKASDAKMLAVTIAQGGEFAFVVFTVALNHQLLSKEWTDALVLIVTISMAATPFLVNLMEKALFSAEARTPKTFDTIEDEDNPVIVAGFGRIGQIVGRVLRVRKVGFTALEHDQEQVNILRKFGNKVYYGDATRIELLEAAGARKAKYLVLAISKLETSLKIVTLVQKHFPHLKILARARNRQHAFELLGMGVTIVHRETLAASTELTRDLLLELGFDPDDVTDTIEKFRKHDEDMLQQQFKLRHNEQELINYSKQWARQLEELFASDPS